jgi:hypothetical protein
VLFYSLSYCKGIEFNSFKQIIYSVFGDIGGKTYICTMKELWRQHPCIDERYEFSNLGRFKNRVTNKLLKPTLDMGGGYVCFFKLRNKKERKRFKLHRIVAELYVPNPNPLTNILVKHVDEDRTNNKHTNLEWVTNVESVNIDILRGTRNRSSGQKISEDDVIKIRHEFDETDINVHDLAVNYNVTSDTILSTLKYKTFKSIQPEKKDIFKINNLSGEEYKSFNLAKMNYKTSKISHERRLAKRNDYKSSKNYIAEDVFTPIMFDYVNSGMSNEALGEKYKISKTKLLFNIKHHDKPDLVFYENEKLLRLNSIWFSTHGRLFNYDKTKVISKYTVAETTLKKMAKILATEFYQYDSKKYSLNYIDDDSTNFSLTNLKLTKLPEKTTLSPQLIEIIKSEYINTPISQKELILKYNITYKNVSKALFGVKKLKICSVCSTNNQTDFIKYNKTKHCDTCYSKNPKLYVNLTDEEKQLKITKSRERAKNNPIKTKLLSAKNRAKLKKLDFDLDEVFIFSLFEKQNKKCYYSGFPISLEYDNNVFSIDRINSNMGYTKNNVCLCLTNINYMKSDLNIEDFLETVEAIYKHSILKKNPKKF